MSSLLTEFRDLDTHTCDIGRYLQTQHFRDLPPEDQTLLRDQHSAMSEYRRILSERITRARAKKQSLTSNKQQ